MKILIATDKFKGCLSAFNVAGYLKEGLLKASGSFDIKCLPVADGGEGTMEVLVQVLNGEIVSCSAHDPLMRVIQSKYGVINNGTTAVIDMASASGLTLLSDEEKNPWMTTSYGTGELILDAYRNGCRRFIIGIGGSATNDGGTGMFRALGMDFFDKDGNEIALGGGALLNLQSFSFENMLPGIRQCEFIVAYDVSNPLVGKVGASLVYSPQKGADPQMAEELDNSLNHLAEVIQNQLGMDVRNIPGSGAAGGLGAGLLAFMNGKLEAGFDIIRKETDLDKLCEWADIVITGEGKIDYQTAFGKAPQGVANAAKLFKKPVIAIAGTLGEDYTNLYKTGFDSIFSIVSGPMSIKEAMENAPGLLKEFAFSLGRILSR